VKADGSAARGRDHGHARYIQGGQQGRHSIGLFRGRSAHREGGAEIPGSRRTHQHEAALSQISGDERSLVMTAGRAMQPQDGWSGAEL
jgi:hypothetical protein